MEVYMKKLFVLLMIVIMIAGTVSAQTIREQERNTAPQPGYNRDRFNNSVTVEGDLKLDKGFVAVESAGTVYYVPMLNRYIGFITGLKEGAKVSVEGHEFRNTIQPTKVTVDGKSYDFMDHGPGYGYGRQNYQYRDNNRRGSPNSQWNNNYGHRNRNGGGGCWCW
jgi:hypothetical protein